MPECHKCAAQPPPRVNINCVAARVSGSFSDLRRGRATAEKHGQLPGRESEAMRRASRLNETFVSEDGPENGV